MPLSVAGGIRNIENSQEMFKAGADKIIINSDGSALRDFISLDLVYETIVRLVGKDRNIPFINVCSGNTISIREIAHKISKNNPDTFSLQTNFNDGSIATIHYFAIGNRNFPKERLEIFSPNVFGKLYLILIKS